MPVRNRCREQLTEAPQNPLPDERFKSDIILILAHPDDETAIGSYLAKAVFDDKRRVSAIYLNRGNGGGNSSGNEQGLAMANISEIEVRRALAKFDITNFYIGCDARAYFQMDPDMFMERFLEVFNYATITHYLQSISYQDFEPLEGQKIYQPRTSLLDELKKKNITVEGRPLFWFYRTTTPDWLRNKSFDALLKYVESHTREVVGHYGERMYAWEIVNEAHDWANELRLKPERIIEVTKLACEVAMPTNPGVHRRINNCCPFAEYVQLKKWGELESVYPQRTPHKFMKDLVAAEVDFTITGQQMYFPYRDLSDTILWMPICSGWSRWPKHTGNIN
jgi:hypothetical protein